MKNLKRLLAIVLVMATVLCLCAGCGKEEAAGETGAATESSEDAGNGATGVGTAHTVTVVTNGNLPLAGVKVSVYADDTFKDMKGYDETDEKGVATMTLPAGGNYAIVIDPPKGYIAESVYHFTGTSASITVSSELVKGDMPSDLTLGVGDVMYDMTVKTPDGTAITLSELLKEKDMILLNFWYTTCSWCVTEFPYMEEAYRMYQDDVAIVALNPTGETDDAIANFPASYNLDLTFPLAACPANLANVFSISGYPTSVVIDRYGVICLVEPGAITSLRPFVGLFDTFTGEDYQQKLYSNIGELVTQVKPTYEMASPEEIGAILNSGEIEVTYRPETEGEEAEYAWPFIEAEKNGDKCLKASNQQIDGSYAILYADVTLKAGQALGFDFLRSTEAINDVLHVIVNDEAIVSISGVLEQESWEKCYPVVALEDGVYEVALCYIKDDSTNTGDDTVYIKNMRVVDAANIDAPTHIPRQAANSENGFDYTYVELVYNETDGYYHVGTADGPLLLANLMGYTQFNEEKSLWELAYEGKIKLDGKDYMEELEIFCNYASNSNLNGICTVNQELYDLLGIVDQVLGFNNDDKMEWLKLCKYFQAYGTNGEQLEDPIRGLATFSALTASEGKDVATNFFYYNRIIMPRGMFAEFIPTRSGVYRITSKNESQHGVDGWIFDENRQELLVYEYDERLYEDSDEVSMVFYMEAGKPYYIDIAFWDPYEVGYIYYDIEFLGESLEHFRLCSPGPFTYDSDATGEAMYHVIHGGIKAVLGEDGYYYEDLGNGRKGSLIYADFSGYTSLFNTPIASVGGEQGMIDKGGFDFSKNEEDQYVLAQMAKVDGDPEKTKELLKEQWGADYEANLEIYQVEDVLAGIYHGKGEDLTEQIRAYLPKMISDGHAERAGCVPVDAELAEILQKLMEKYTFENVDQGWLKLCYYYDYLGPEA